MDLNTTYIKCKRVDHACVSAAPLAGREELVHGILSPAAERFLASLQLRFGPERIRLLQLRQERTLNLRAGATPELPPETEWIRRSEWKVAPTPRQLRRRHVEITGPAEAKMMINALNSGADVFMADLEDSLSPTWENVLQAHQNLLQAATGTLTHAGENGKTYRLNPEHATLVMRPRGWHLPEKHFLINGEPISASLFDFGLYFFHCAKLLLKEGMSGPYFYLPKLESHLEARLWNDVFVFAQHTLGLPVGTIRATVLIETLPAAFEMDEILYELRDHAAGLNAGRWDYLFSFLKNLPLPAEPYPDRAQLTMDLPFLRAYCEALVRTCHRRGAHAIGGMAAFIPSRKDPAVNEAALAKVKADKARELAHGFDGTWVAHPDLVPVVKEQFHRALGDAEHQKHVIPAGETDARSLLPRNLPGAVTEAGVRTNLYVTLKYLHHWLKGQGAVAIHNLMEDAATAEISRSQLWQWVQQCAVLNDGYPITEGRLRTLLELELSRFAQEENLALPRRVILKELVLQLTISEDLADFLTLPAYELLRDQEFQAGINSNHGGISDEQSA